MPQNPQQELYPQIILISLLQDFTGGVTVAKVETKKELLRMLNSFDPLITGFGREALDYDMLPLVEQLLINVVTKTYRSCSTFNELRAKLYHHQSNNKKCCLSSFHFDDSS